MHSSSAESALENPVYIMKSMVIAYLGFFLPRKALDLEMERVERVERDFYG